MGRTIPFLNVASLRRLREFQAETGLTLDEVHEINYWTDIDWKRHTLRIGEREIALSERVEELLVTQFHCYGGLWRVG